MIISLTFVFAASFFALSGLGFLATIASASIGAMKWGKEEAEIVEEDIGYFWKFIQVPLFGLIGASIYVPDLVPEIVGLGFVVLLVGLSFRFPVAYISMMNTPMNFKERVFVAIAWMPKATV